MIPKTCPLKDKLKLGMTLLGECEFAIFLPKKYCKKCRYEKKDNIADMLGPFPRTHNTNALYPFVDVYDTYDAYEG